MVEPITIDGRYFWQGKERFIVRGVVYQPYTPEHQFKGAIDPLDDSRIPELQRDLALFTELGLNTLFVFFIDSTKSHDEAMKLLADAGIYVFVVLSTPHQSINRATPLHSYKIDLLNHFFSTLDCMAAYRNTIGLIAGNKVINNARSTVAAEVIRAVVRDLKRYMKLRKDSGGQRVLPVGINSADVIMYQKPQFQYLSAGRREEAIDFFSFNCYSWIGKSSMRISGYNGLVTMFSDAHIPVFFSEYGGNTYRPRLFQETKALLSPEMTHVFSGGCVYEFCQHVNEYGLVKFEECGTITRLPDFKNYKVKLRESSEPPRTDEEWAFDELTAHRAPSFPPTTSSWQATPVVPPSPLDWSVVAQQIEEKEWIIIDSKEDGHDGDARNLKMDNGASSEEVKTCQQKTPDGDITDAMQKVNIIEDGASSEDDDDFPCEVFD